MMECKYKPGKIINNYELIEELERSKPGNKRRFKVKCLRCGEIFEKTVDSICRTKNDKCKHQDQSNKNSIFTVNGITKNLNGWAKELGVTLSCVWHKYRDKGEDGLIQYIKKKLLEKEGKLVDKYSIGTVINNFELIEELERSKDHHRQFKVKCTKCGHIIPCISTNILLQLDNNGPCKHIKIKGWNDARLRGIFNNMIYRCTRENRTEYNSYGGRGIKVCDEWVSNPDSFRDWTYSHGYKEDLTIDRIDPDKDYCPENCRWIPLKENAKWHRDTKKFIVNGEADTLTSWSKRANISFYKLNNFSKTHTMEETVKIIQEYLNGNKVLETEHKTKGKYIITVNNESKSATDWARYFNKNISYFTHMKNDYNYDMMVKKIEEMYWASKKD